MWCAWFSSAIVVIHTPLYFISDKYQISEFLNSTLPYLVVKKEKAQKALEEISNRIESDRQKEIIKQERILSATQLRSSGHSYRKIGQELGLDWSSVRQLLNGTK